MRPTKTLGSQSNMVFDCNYALCFIVTMTNSVEAATMKYVIPGGLYTFIFKQDGNGGYSFAWPGNCINAAPVDMDPNATTVQNFIGTDAGTLEVNLPGTWF